MARVQSAAKSVAKKPVSVIKSKSIASEELAVAPEKAVEFSNAGRKDIISDIEIQGDVHGLANKAEKLKFLEELVTIEIAESSEKNPDKYVFLSVNGIGAGPNNIPWVPRGVPVTIKRKYLNVLSGARSVRYINYEYTTNEGERKSGQRGSSSDRYPFTVIRDDNPRGLDWLRELRASKRAG